MRPDSQIRQVAEDQLRGDPEIDPTDIAVTVNNSVVTLSVYVRSYPQKIQAEYDATRVSGVVAVANDIEVRLPGLDERPDPQIVRDVVTALKMEVRFSSEGIQVIARNGWLKLERKTTLRATMARRPARARYCPRTQASKERRQHVRGACAV